MNDDKKLLERMYISDTIKHYEYLIMSPGTFTIISMQCDHEYRLWLKIDKDAGMYQGRIVN